MIHRGHQSNPSRRHAIVGPRTFPVGVLDLSSKVGHFGTDGAGIFDKRFELVSHDLTKFPEGPIIKVSLISSKWSSMRRTLFQHATEKSKSANGTCA